MTLLTQYDPRDLRRVQGFDETPPVADGGKPPREPDLRAGHSPMLQSNASATVRLPKWNLRYCGSKSTLDCDGTMAEPSVLPPDPPKMDPRRMQLTALRQRTAVVSSLTPPGVAYCIRVRKAPPKFAPMDRVCFSARWARLGRSSRRRYIVQELHKIRRPLPLPLLKS
jgi:hypothetical protein